jgi:dTDP-glucose 4,6-dehydratase
MNFLITGGCGFIGSNFINYLFEHHDKNINTIINVDKLNYCANVNNVEYQENTKYIFKKGDICNVNYMYELLLNNKITHIIHFAAQSHVCNSFEQSLDYTHDNVLGTHCILEAVRQYGNLQLMIHISTDEVYGETVDNNQCIEHSVLCPTNPYAATKAAAELMVDSYVKSFKLPCIVTRGNNVYGKNQYPEKLIPKFIKQLKNNEKLTIHGDGNALRSFIHVNDVCEAIWKVLEHGTIGEVYNIGSDDNEEYSVNDIAMMITQHFNKNFEENVVYVRDRPYNDKRYFINANKLKMLGWKTNNTLKEYIKNIIY